MQPHPMTSVMQLLVTFCALVIAADLVRIGVSVLRVNPEKEKQISAAREWALNLIDDNSGRVKFSPEAREQLLKKRLETYGTGYPDGTYGNGGYADGTYGSVYPDSRDYTPDKPASRSSSAEPRK